jgi:hypothetical protein
MIDSVNPPDLLLDGPLDLTMVPEPSLVSRQCLGKRKAHRSRIEKANNRETVTLTLDPKSEFGSEGVLPGAYCCHHHRRRCLGARCADGQGESSARRTSTARRREGQGHWRHH